ncbi:hypothetical protein SX4_3151 [Vibrio mimicus SX-4]|nr:hypothetical protein VII_001098 [Vibrio mimicus MB451]EGU19395.1 hypothetical protein SX4_3151 [Vibrio mimicus SX-4]
MILVTEVEPETVISLACAEGVIAVMEKNSAQTAASAILNIK